MNASKAGPPLASFAARTKDEEVLKASSSGGIFTELARAVLARGGVVSGAAWTEWPLRVAHKVVDDEAGLAELRGSKYVFSDMKGVWGELQRFLSEGRLVLFTGVPCQTAAVRHRFRNADNLLLCGVICHSGPDPKVWRTYADGLERKARSRLVGVRFRDKTDGWQRCRMVLEYEDVRKNTSMPLPDNEYYRAFGEGLAARDICLRCPFRSGRAGQDLLLGDFWGIDKVLPDWNDGRGVSAVMACSERGLSFFNALDIEREQVKYEQILEKNPMLEHVAVPDAAQRRFFLEHYGQIGVERALRLVRHGKWTRRVLLWWVNGIRRFSKRAN